MSDIIIYGAGATGVALKSLLKNNNALLYDDDPTKSQVKDVDFDKVELVVTSPGIPPNSPFLAQCFKRGIKVIGELQLCYWLCSNKIVSVTGTNGKTTVTQLIKHMLDACGEANQLLGNGGVPFSQGLQSLNAQDIVVLESSSFQLKDCTEFAPTVSAVTNIAPDHLDYHHSYQDYINAKLNNFLHQNNGQFAVFNLDDQAVVDCSGLANAQRLFYSTSKPCNCYYDDGKVVVDVGVKHTVDLEHAFSNHNLSNVLCATLCVAALGVDIKKAIESISTFSFDKHRMQFVGQVGNVCFVDDSKATNIHAVISALQSTAGDVYLILGGIDKGLDFEQLVCCTHFKKVRFVACIGETACKLSSLLMQYGICHEKCQTLQQATQRCYDEAKATGGTVLLSPACSSFDMFESYKQRGVLFQRCAMELSND